ncbi:ABC transporter ATP-binding protein [Rhodovulum sp. BSW8]|uniref:ABC transporter ATP-binding protein n=1 Tax=Rhodovulum visakhapatnamense TaxID=364297 RepID=A0ABS1RDF7_9RHOB|nr:MULTISPECIES: ABC transporter ATP-binding protein [Rhodovulum]MBL3569518.1 ABC transporter ATP-binding protein [Rhodovulum visakhapatnamense]MBL3577668.1 ABC transporter ATP-binding protein [Rhodovulum visakhapatnamense]OLS43332.1 spermidine/putrescine ABC transporter ATP-binding protein [Rhodovulum sulfidophilum]RBO52283.1 ABC transporter ATP-binding protein [Rhodovulum sp. BSW8]
MSAIDIQNLGKSFGRTEVLGGVSLAVGAGEFVAILGPSGCGKTTLLRLLAGFERPDRGSIRMGGRLVSGPGVHLPPEGRGVGVVFQTYALWPHMSVAGNVAYGLKVGGMGRAPREARTQAVLETVGLGEMAARRPADLSGGQRQRVALARCLAMEARVVLLDEPLANLDVHLRDTLEAEFADFHRRSGATMVYVTHDQAEALALADRVAVMEAGRIVQFAPPERLFREPACAMVAGFIGDGRVVEVTDLAPSGDGRAEARLLGAPVRLRCAPGERPRPRARIALHPGDLHLTEGEGVAATVTRATFRGHHLRAELAAGPDGGVSLCLNVAAPARIERGQRVTVALTDGWVLPDPSLPSLPTQGL